MTNPWEDNYAPAAPVAPPSPQGITQAITFPALDVNAPPPPEKKGSALSINRDIGPWQPDYKAPPTPPDPDVSGYVEHVQNNLTKHLTEQAAKVAEPKTGAEVTQNPAQKQAKDFYDSFEAGFQMSVDGLIKRHALPDTVLPEHADWFMRTAAFAGQTVGDLKTMAAGGAIGTGLGVEAGPIGALVAGPAGAFGLPPLMRQALINEYQKGSIKEFSDFWQRASGTFLAGAKGAAVGVGSALAGIAGQAAPYVGGPLTGKLAEIAAMTNIGTALDGHIANRQDYLDSATALLGYHAVSMGTGVAAVGVEKVAGKLGDIYAKTGAHPAEVVLAAQDNPVLRQDLLSNNLTVPEAYNSGADPKLHEPVSVVIKPSETSNVLTGDNGREQTVSVEKTAWHGTPHDFENFTTQAINTGEGSQMEGWGLYFADQKGVADWYRSELSGKNVTVSVAGKEVSSYANGAAKALQEAYRLVKNTYQTPDGNFLKKGEKPPIDAVVAQAKKANPSQAEKIDAYAKQGLEIVPAGRLYEVAIKPPENLFLQSDKSFGEQTPEVKKILQPIREALGLNGDPTFLTGGYIYDELVKIEGSPEKASRFLNENGIPGIKYKDYDHASDTHNYVLFDDSHVETRAKYDANGKLLSSVTPYEVETPPPAHPIDKQIVWGGGSGKKEPTSFNKMFARIFDQLDPIKQARNALFEGGDKIKVIDDPYWLRRLLNGANAKAKEAITGEGPRDFQGNKTGTPSLAKIVEAHKDDRIGFTRYLVAATNLERAEKGIKTGFVIEGPGGLREVYDSGKGQYDKAARQVTELMNDSLDKLVAAGVVEKGAAEASKGKWKYYSPQYQETETAPAMGRKSTTFKKITGKEMGAKVLDPIDKIIQTIYARERIVAHNESVKALGKLVEYNEPAVGETVATKIKAEGPDLIQESELSDPDTVKKLSSKPGEVTYFENGQRTTLRVPEDVAKAIDGIGPPQANLIVQAARPMAQLERAGAINSFSFLTRHIIRSEGQAPLLSQHGYWPVLGFMRGMFHTITGTDVFQDARYMGALQETVQSLHDDYIAKDVFKLQKETGMMDSIPNLLKSPAAATRAALDFMHDKIVSPIANAPRVEEYRLAMKGKERTRENMLEAARAAREVLPDSSRIGSDAAVKAFSQITPFWNVHLQGSLRLAEALRDRPVATVLKGALTITAPSMLLWYANRNDKDIQQSDNYTRDMTWQFVDHNWQPATDIQQRNWPEHLLRQTPWGTVEADNKIIYKVPKPFEPGVVFGSLFERMADAIYKKDPRAFEGFDRTMEEALKAAPLPAALAPMAEQWANKSTLNGAPLVPHRLEGLLPKAQYTDYTSETAKQLGSIIGQIPAVKNIGPENEKLASPIIIDNYVRSWLGGTGQLAVKLVDKALDAANITPPNQKAAPGPADTPYVGAFIWRYPNTNARSIREFFDRSAQNKRELDTFQYLVQHKDAFEGVKTLIDSLEQGNASSLEGIKTAVSGMQKVTADLALIPDKNMSKSDKRQLTDGLMYKSVEIAEAGNKAFAAFEAAMKDKGPELEALRKKIEGMQEVNRAPKSVAPQIPAPQIAPTPTAPPAAPTPVSKPARQQIPSPTQTLGTNKIEEGLKKAEMGQ